MSVPIIEIEEGMPVDYLKCILEYIKSEYPTVKRFRLKKTTQRETKKRT